MTAATARDAGAVALLHALCGPHGIHASRAATTNYRAVFARDAVMAGVAGLLLDDAAIAEGLRRTLVTLRAAQGPEGQVASNVEVQPDGSWRTSFGTLAPRLDGATWYLLGLALGARAGVVRAGDFADSARRVVRLLDALEYNGRHLLYVPAGGNWADEYPYDGYILYDQVLRAWALRLLATTYGEPAWAAKAQAIAGAIDARYFPDDRATPVHPLAAFSPVRRQDTFDLAACALLGVSGLLPARAAQALGWIDATFLQGGALPPAFHPVIAEGDPDWPALRHYHLHGFRNAPHEYHNGGIWPIWLGWLALALAQCGHDGALARLRAASATALDAAPGFAFQEYLHGRTGAPLGTPDMAYSATGLVFLRLAGSDAPRRVLAP